MNDIVEMSEVGDQECTDLETISCILKIAQIPHRIDWDFRDDWWGYRQYTGAATLLVGQRFGFGFERGRLVHEHTEAWPESIRSLRNR